MYTYEYANVASGAQGHSGGLFREQAGLGVQFVALGQREFQNVIRDKASLGARFGSAIVLNLIFALIFFRVGDTGVCVCVCVCVWIYRYRYRCITHTHTHAHT